MVKPFGWWCPTAEMYWGTHFLKNHKIESAGNVRNCEVPHIPLYSNIQIRKAWEEFAEWIVNNDTSCFCDVEARRRAKEFK